MMSIIHKHFFYLFLFLSSLSRAQNWQWALPQKVNLLAADPAGNVLVLQDSTLKKLSSSGTVSWQKQFRGDIHVVGLVSDEAGNFYIAGNFQNFSYEGQSFVTSGITNSFLACLNSSGALVWNKTYGGGSTCVTNDISVGANRVNFCGCAYAGSSIENHNYDTTGFFFASLDLSGNMQTIRKYAGASGWEIDSDSLGNIYVLGGGEEGDSIKFENGLSLRGYFPGFHYIAKYDPNGIMHWARSYGGNYYAPHRTLAVNANGTFYLSQWQRYGGFDLSRYDADGTSLWLRNFDDVYGDCSSLLIDKHKNVWITGGMWTCDGNCLTPFLWKVNDSGRTLDSTMQTYSARSDGIVRDGSNNVYVHGSFGNSQSFGSTTLYGAYPSYYLAKLTDETSLSSFANNLEQAPFAVYPNPAQNYLTISMNSDALGGQLTIYDVRGERYLSRSVDHTLCQIETTQMPNGIYFVELDSGKKRFRTKVVVEK